MKQTLLAVPAAALMLGAAQAGTTVGLNFQDWYYSDGGAGYQTTGMPVTGPAFGVALANWYSTPPLDCRSATDIIAPFGGTLDAHVMAPNAWQSGIGMLTADWVPVTVSPGNNEVTWGYISSGYGNGGADGSAPSVTVSHLAAKFPNGYVVQTIAAHQGNATFNDVDFTDGTTTTTSAYSTYFVKGPVADGYGYGSGTVGLSAPSGVFTSDTININPQAQTAGSHSVLAGFIITDKPVISGDPAGGVFVQGTPFSLSAGAIGLPSLAYQWRKNGATIPGATAASYTNTSSVVADAGSYDLVVTNIYGAATSAVATVTIVGAHPAQTVTWDANLGTSGPQDGDGTWNFTPAHWWNGTSNCTWWVNDTAIFGLGGAGPYNVTLGASMSASAVTFNSGNYTITNTSGATLTLDGVAAITANAAGTIGAPVSTGTNTFLKAGTGTLTLAGTLACAQTFVSAGTLEVLAKSGDSPYIVTNGTTLKLGYSTGGGYANTGMRLYGDGTAATTGLYLRGGARYNVSGQVNLLGAPTTIRQYGSGMASFGIFDINSTGLLCSSAASGSIIDANIQMISRGYGMAAQIDAGTNTATGDLILNGPLNVGSMGFYKRGGGSLRLNAPALTNLALQVVGGTVICGAVDCIGTNAALFVVAGATLDFNGFSQTVSNVARLDGALKMSLKKGSTPNCTVLTATDGSPIAYGGTLVVTNTGAALAIGDTFILFSASGGYGGGFTSVTLPPLANGQGWQDNLLADGSVKVVAGSTPPTIVTDLAGITNYAYVGANASYTVTATGDPVLHYLWRKNGTTPVGSDSNTLTLTSVTLAADANYSVTVTNSYGKAQSQTNHLTVVTPSAYGATVVLDSPASYWPLSETVDPTAFDYSGGGNNGTQNGTLALGVAGPRPPTYQGFQAGKLAYQFDGTGGYIDCGTAASLSGTTDFTLEVWINTTNTASSMILQQRTTGGSGYDGEYMLKVNGNGTVAFMVYGGGYQFDFSSPATSPRVSDGKWHHVAAVRSGTNGIIYVDGSALATSSSSTTLRYLTGTLPVVIGKDFRDDNSYFNGQMCDVAIYSHALSATRIASHAVTGFLATSPLVLSIVPGGFVQDTKPGTPKHDGLNNGASWLASSTDAIPVTRIGVERFSNGAQVALPANADFNSTIGTICFWMRTGMPAAGTGAMLFDRRTSNGVVIVLDGTPTGGLNIQYTGNPTFSVPANVIDDNWHHVACVYDQSANGMVALYVDGVLAGSQANSAAWSWVATQQIELARSHDPYWQQYNGQMDDVRIYNRILTDAEITTIATPATSDTLVDTAALKGRYNFDTAAGLGKSLSWPLGLLESSPTLGPSAIWTPVSGAVSPYPFLLVPEYTPTNRAAFYRLKL